MASTPRWLRVAEDIVQLSNTWTGRSPGAYISLDSLNAVRGHVPLSLLMERIWRDNCPLCTEFDRLSPEFRQPVTGSGYIGGVAMLPVDYAREQGLDPRDAWTSVYMLAVRLRDIAEARVRQYSGLWEDANCRDIRIDAMTRGVAEYAENDVDRMVPGIFYTHGNVGWRAISQGTVTDREIDSERGEPFPSKVCFDGGVPADVGVPGYHALARYNASSDNYYGVYNDLGFWKAVLLEERVTTPFRGVEDSRKALMDRLWDEFLRGGLAAFLTDREGGEEVAALLWYYGLVFTVSAFAWMQDVVLRYNEYVPDVRARLGFSPADISMLRGHLTAVNEIAGGTEFTAEQPTWGLGGAYTWQQPDWVGKDSFNPAAVSVELLRASTAGWSAETDRWAGGLYQTPPVVGPPRPRPRPGVEPVARTRSAVVPVMLGVGIPLLGYAVLQGAGGKATRT